MKKIALITLLAGLISCQEKTAVKSGHEGEPLPSFDLLLTDSTTHFNTQNIQAGQPFALLFVGTHCPFSRAQMDDIIKNERELQHFHFYVFTIESLSQMRDFYTHYNLGSYANLTIGLDHDNFFPMHFQDMAVPYLAIYNKEKKLTQVFQGTTSASVIEKALEKD